MGSALPHAAAPYRPPLGRLTLDSEHGPEQDSDGPNKPENPSVAG